MELWTCNKLILSRVDLDKKKQSNKKRWKSPKLTSFALTIPINVRILSLCQTMSQWFVSEVLTLSQMGPWEIVSHQLTMPLMPIHLLPLWESRPYLGYGREHNNNTFYFPFLETCSSLFLHDKAPETATFPYFVMPHDVLHDFTFYLGIYLTPITITSQIIIWTYPLS